MTFDFEAAKMSAMADISDKYRTRDHEILRSIAYLEGEEQKRQGIHNVDMSTLSNIQKDLLKKRRENVFNQ